MNDDTLQRILVAISWLSFHGMEVNKKRVQRYTGLSYPTVIKYFNEIPSLFLIDSSKRFDESYIKKPIERRTKVCNQKNFLFT